MRTSVVGGVGRGEGWGCGGLVVVVLVVVVVAAGYVTMYDVGVCVY